MWKVGLVALGIIGAAVGFANGAKLAGVVGAAEAPKPLDIPRLLADEAERANKKRGTVNGHSIFVGAEVRGQRLSFQYELKVNPRSLNTAAVKDEFYRKALPLACKSDTALRRALIQGATIEYAYRTADTKQYLFEVNLNGASCRA